MQKLFPRWGWPDWAALTLSMLAVLVSYWITQNIFEATAHLEDEMAYVWQAEVIARGELTLPSPEDPKSFLVPFVVDFQGQRFGKYPLAWPTLLGIAIRLNLRSWVNPLLAGLAVWLTYRLGRRTFNVTVALLAALLTLISPFFLLNSGSLLSHPFSLVLALAFALAWFDAFIPSKAGEERQDGSVRWDGRRVWLPTLVAAFCLGVLALTRPLTAVGVGLPFGIHGIYLLLKGDRSARTRVLTLGAVAVGLGAVNFLWQYAVTGDPFLNPYTLWWEYDKIGFGPGVGVTKNGHTLHMAWVNTKFSLWTGWQDFFGWPHFSWLFLPFGLIALVRLIRSAKDRGLRGVLAVSLFPSLLLLYTAYWIGSWLFGPRYYYEGLPSLTLLSAAGIACLAGWPLLPDEPWRVYCGLRKARPLLVTGLTTLLLAMSVLFYTPARLDMMRGLYGVERAKMAPFLTQEAQALTPALVIVHPAKEWIEYGTLLELQDPFLDTPFIFVISRGAAQDARVAARFPERATYHYYPSDGQFALLDKAKP